MSADAAVLFCNLQAIGIFSVFIGKRCSCVSCQSLLQLNQSCVDEETQTENLDSFVSILEAVEDQDYICDNVRRDLLSSPQALCSASCCMCESQQM